MWNLLYENEMRSAYRLRLWTLSKTGPAALH
jgi:hypothetical protein